jgi:hypothetical protein
MVGISRPERFPVVIKRQALITWAIFALSSYLALSAIVGLMSVH